MFPNGAVSLPRLVLVRVLALIALLSLPGRFLLAAEVAPRPFAIPAGEGADTLKVFAVQAQCEIMFPSEPVAGVKTNPVNGTFTSRDALERLIAGTGLVIVEEPKTGALMITRPAATVAHLSKPSSDPNSLSEKSLPPVKRKNPFAIIGSFLALAIAPVYPAHAADNAAASITGRVQNVVTGQYLNNARITVRGTALAVFTDQTGTYQLPHVPPGSVTLEVFYTELDSQSATVDLRPGLALTKDFDLTSAARYGDGNVVKLSAFTVATSRETNANAIAINEQRFSPNLKNVVAADEFGAVTEGNIGEFLKFLPGVTLDYTSADARYVSVRGLPNANSAVTVDGNRIANTNGGIDRAFQFDQLSINNVSRIEVTKGPTPESSADAIGGTINLVSKSAFERSRSEFTYRVVLGMNQQSQQDVQYLSFGASPGTGRDPRAKILPGFDFSYVNPVTKNFGFTLSGYNSNTFNQQYSSAQRWSPTSNVGPGGTLANPAMTTYQFNDGPKLTSRYSTAATIDWRVATHDVVNIGVSWNAFDALFNNHVTTINTGAPSSWGPTFTRGGTGGSVALAPSERLASRITYALNARYQHDGRVWKFETSAYSSRSKALSRDIDRGCFQGVTYNLSGLNVRFDDINVTRPDTISATTAAGTAVDIRQLGGYTIGAATIQPVDVYNYNSGVKGSVGRFLNVLGLPIQAKLGVDARRMKVDQRMDFRRWTFVGPDGRSGTADDRAANYDLIDTSSSSIPAPYGNGRWEYPSAYKAFDLFKATPAYFQHDDAFQQQQAVANSKVISEGIVAEYLRLDARLFQNRLWIVAGARYERTYDDGYGPINDISRTYQRNVAGALIDGNPNLAGIQPVKIVGSALDLAKLQYVDRGTHVTKNYGDLYPSLNLTYNITADLIARGSYANTISRPNYTNIIPGTTLPDPSNTSARTITINNTSLKPWTAKNYDLSVTYYPTAGGEVSVGAFRKDIKDFFGGRTFDATVPLLEQYGIDSSYANGGYVISTLQNVGQARISGVEFNYRQPLKFMPSWGRGVSIRYNITQLHLQGTGLADFSTFIRRSMNWGVSLERPRYSVRLNWNLRGRQRQASVAGVAEPGTYAYMNPRLTLDADGEYRLTKAIGIFLGARNVTGRPFIVERYGPSTPAYARRYQRDDYGVAISLGLKGSF